MPLPSSGDVQGAYAIRQANHEWRDQQSHGTRRQPREYNLVPWHSAHYTPVVYGSPMAASDNRPLGPCFLLVELEPPTCVIASPPREGACGAGIRFETDTAPGSKEPMQSSPGREGGEPSTAAEAFTKAVLQDEATTISYMLTNLK